MSSVRQVADRFDELKQNGFEDRQARVLAIAIDETVEDRHAGFLAHIDKRFDDVDKRFDDVDKRFDDVDKRFDDVDKRFDDVDKRFDNVDKKFVEAKKDLAERFDWFVYKVAVLTTAFLAGALAAFLGGFQIVKMLIG